MVVYDVNVVDIVNVAHWQFISAFLFLCERAVLCTYVYGGSVVVMVVSIIISYAIGFRFSYVIRFANSLPAVLFSFILSINNGFCIYILLASMYGIRGDWATVAAKHYSLSLFSQCNVYFWRLVAELCNTVVCCIYLSHWSKCVCVCVHCVNDAPVFHADTNHIYAE